MEKRLAKVNISYAGGTAAKGSKTYKITIPSTWISKLNLDSDEKVELTFDNEKITVTKHMGLVEFKIKNKSHELKTFLYYDKDTLCSCIVADFTEHTLCVENYTTNMVKTAFGKNALPTWDDFMSFLEERCIPRQRDGVNEYLDSIGLDEYDPIEIIKKTKGKMAEDNQRLEIIE